MGGWGGTVGGRQTYRPRGEGEEAAGSAMCAGLARKRRLGLEKTRGRWQRAKDVEAESQRCGGEGEGEEKEEIDR